MTVIEAARPTVAILDIRMPGLDGLEVARRAVVSSPGTGLVILSMHDDEELLDEALAIGIRGYVLKDDAVAEVVTCVRAVASGGTYVSPRLTRMLLAHRAGRQQDARLLDRLTRTERQVLNLLAEGRSSREIAEAMFISVRTAESHRYHICQKLGISGALKIASNENPMGPSPLAIGSPSQSGGVSHTKARMAMTIRSYCQVARS